MSVVGFDDIPLARHGWPPLTTEHQNLTGQGERAVRALLDAIGAPAAEGEDMPVEASDVVPRVVVRESTAPAPVRAR